MKTGKQKSNQFKLVMLGPEGSGKTSSVHALLDKQFYWDQVSTVGVDINHCLTDRIFASKWRQNQLEDQLNYLGNLHKMNAKKAMLKLSRVDNESLSNEAEEIVPDVFVPHIEEVIDTKVVSDDDIRIVIHDLGGQEIYYEAHFLFLAPEDIVLLTFDASKGFYQPVISRQHISRFQSKVAARGMQTNLGALETYFQLVYCRGHTVVGYISNRIPTIIMMATHCSGLSNQQKHGIKLQFYKYFSGTPFLDHLPRDSDDAFHFIDNRYRDPVVFKKVRQVVLKAATNTIEQECPISYLQFETKLLRASEEKPIISLQEAQNIAISAGIEKNLLTEVFLYYCYKGVFLYYPNVAALQQEVFVNPQEFSNLISSVISTHHFEPSSASLYKSYTRYDTYGLLEERLLDDLLMNCGRLQQKETILALLENFDLAVQVPIKTKCFDEEDDYVPPNNGRVFVVPSILVYNEKVIYAKQINDILVLFHYPDKFLPVSIFDHVLVKTVIWCIKEGHYIHR